MAQQKTRTFLLGRFEAGDRPTDQDFANLFESILFLNNNLSGHNNGISTDNTSIEGNFEIGGTLDLTGNFKMGAKLSVGNTAESLQSSISAYNSDNFAVYYASSSLSDIMFEGVSQDVTSSIKLTETLAGSTPAVPSTNTLIFGTSAGRVFLQNDGQEILHMTSSGHNGSSPQVYISGSVGIGSGWDSGTTATGEQLHIQALGEGDATMRLTSDGTANDSIIKLRQSDNVGFDLIYDGGADRFQIKENGGNNPFQIEHGASTNTLFLDDNGQVGIGLSNPSEKLHIKGTTVATNALVQTTTGNAVFKVQTSNSIFSLVGNGASDQFSIYDANSANTPFKLEGGAPTHTLVLKNTGRIGLGTSSPESNLHIIGDPEGLIPMMLIEGGVNIPEQDILILRDLGTADLNKNNIKFEATSGEHTISQIQAITRGSNAASGGDLNIFTYSDDSGTKNANQLFLKNDGKVGIGTDTPGETLDVQGVINSTSEFSAINSDDEGEYRLGSRTDFGLKGTSYSAQLQAPNSVYVMIDSNANDDDSKFKIKKHSSIVGQGTTLFTVDQSGGVTGSAFVGDGSQLTGISGAQITGFVSTPGDNFLVTSNAAGDGVFGEANLTFDGNQLGIGITSPNAGVDVHINHNATDDAVLLLESNGSDYDSIVALRQGGTWPNNATGVDLVYDGGVDKFLIKGYTAGAGFIGNSVSIKPETPTDTLILDASGHIGIGEDPSYKLHVRDDSAAQIAYFRSDNSGTNFIRVERGSNTTIDLIAGATTYGGGLIGSKELRFMVNGDTITSPLMTLNTTNRVGIGTSEPRETLDVIGRITVDNATTGVPAVTIFGEQDSSTHPDIQFEASGVIAASGSLYMNIDADNTTTGTVFAINKDSNTSGATRVFTVNENGTIQLQDTAGTAMMSLSSQINQSTDTGNYDGVFVGETDLRIHKIYFPGAHNDSGFISHESQPNVNNAVLRLVSSDDASGKDYVSIGGSSQVEGIRLFNSGEAHFRGGLAVGHLFNASGTSIAEQVAEGTIHVKTNEDAALWLEADVDNAGGEGHNAYVKLTHDNSVSTFYLGTVGIADDTPEAVAATDTLANSLYIGSKTAHPIQLVTSNVARLTVASGGNVGIGDKSPAEKLVVDCGDDNLISRFHSTSNEDTVKGIRINSKDANGDQIYMDLVVDPKNQKVGIGIGTAGGNLPIGDANLDNAELVIESTGDVGIGTSSPTTKLHVYDSTLDNDILLLDGTDSGFGTGTAGLNAAHSSLTIRSSSPVSAAEKISQLNLKVDSTNLWQLLTDNGDGNRFHIQYNNDDSKRFLTVETGGLVGIGTDDPAYALDVAGSVMSNLSSTSGRFLLGGNTESGMVMENSHVQIMSKGHVIAMVDSNANETDKCFKVQFNSATVNGGTERFRVQEDGLAYFNDGMYIQSSVGLSGLADSVFAGESGTLRRHIFYFPAAAGSNDPGRIEHLTSTTQTNAAVIRLVPSDDQGTQDYVTICGSDEPEMIRLFTTGEGHFRGGLGVGSLWNQVGNDTSAGTHVNGSQIADGVIDIKSNSDAGIFLRADVDNSTESHNPFIQMTQDGTYVGGIIGLGESDTVGPRGDTIRYGTTNAMYMYSSDSFLDTSNLPADLHLGAGSTMALTITDKLGDEDVGVIIGPETTHYKYGSDTYPALSIKMKTQATMTLSTTCTNVQTNSEHGGGLALIDNDTNKSAHIELFNGTDLLFGFRSNSSTSKVKVRGYIRHDVNLGAITFTGQHKNVPETGVADDYIHHVGKIVISKGTYKNLNLDQISDKPNINEALPKVALSSQTNDKRVWGVVSDAEDSSESRRTDTVGAFVSIYPKQDNRIIVNSVGEGGILVSNYNGDLENGDYITTCPLEGLGMKQDDDLLHNYTVAKITQDCDFTSDTTDVTHDGQTYKMKFVGCTYHCG